MNFPCYATSVMAGSFFPARWHTWFKHYIQQETVESQFYLSKYEFSDWFKRRILKLMLVIQKLQTCPFNLKHSHLIITGYWAQSSHHRWVSCMLYSCQSVSQSVSQSWDSMQLVAAGEYDHTDIISGFPGQANKTLLERLEHEAGSCRNWSFWRKEKRHEQVLLCIVDVAIGKVYRSQLCILIELVLTFCLRHSRALNS